MSSTKLAAALIMPFALGSLQVRAQMVPAESLPVISESRPVESSSASIGYSAVSATEASTASGLGGGVQLPPPSPAPHKPFTVHPLSTLAMGITGGTLGAGAEFATPLARKLNFRVGGSYVNLQYPFTIDGVDYNAAMKLTSGQALVDWYPTGGGFHLSAGALYFKSSAIGAASVGPGQQFKLGDTSYLNSVDDPVQGIGSLKFTDQQKVAPMVLIGFGNLIPRSGRHISVPFEIGGAYLSPPQVGIQLAGTACTNQGCFNAATDPAVQANIASEQNKLDRDIRPLQIYPIVSIGFALRF